MLIIMSSIISDKMVSYIFVFLLHLFVLCDGAILILGKSLAYVRRII